MGGSENRFVATKLRPLPNAMRSLSKNGQCKNPDRTRRSRPCHMQRGRTPHGSDGLGRGGRVAVPPKRTYGEGALGGIPAIRGGARPALGYNRRRSCSRRGVTLDIKRKIRRAEGLTPTEQQLGLTALKLGESIRRLSIKEFAAEANVSVASIHRFCKKLGLEGFKDLKVELTRLATSEERKSSVDINFPIAAGAVASEIMPQIEELYEVTLRETRAMVDIDDMNRAAELIQHAAQVDIYTQSHNLYPAQMFRDRLLSAGKTATCYENFESQVRTAMASDTTHVAIVISYSGLADNLKTVLPLLSERKTPVIVIGTPYCKQLHPGFAAYLLVSDRESLQHRITQYASHIAVQYVLDALYSCFFARDYERAIAFLEASLPYTCLISKRNRA